MSRLSMLSVLALAAYLGSCTPELPTPPNLEPVLTAYENPRVEVGREVMEEWAEYIEEAAKAIEDSDIFDELLKVIGEVQTELDNSIAMTCQGGSMNGSTCNVDEDCEGGTCTGASTLVLGGVCDVGSDAGAACASVGDCPGGGCAGGGSLPGPTGAFQINYICPGWDVEQFDPDYLKTCGGGANAGSACTDDTDCPDSTCVEAKPDTGNGSIDLFITLDTGGIGRVVWGTATQCRYLVPIEGADCDAGCVEGEYDGGVALDLGNDDWVNEDLERLLITFVVEGTIFLDSDELRINQSFRVILDVESGLEILIDIGDVPLDKTFNYIFAADAQLIRDANGVFGCSLQDSECFERTCEGGTNQGNVCIDDANCPEGTCEKRILFSW